MVLRFLGGGIWEELNLNRRGLKDRKGVMGKGILASTVVDWFFQEEVNKPAPSFIILNLFT